MTTAHLDYETFSAIDLPKLGLGRYAAHESTDVLCVAYALDSGPVRVWLPGDPLPSELFAADHFVAHNAAFERGIWNKVLYRLHRWPDCPPLSRWTCSMAVGQSYGLPGGLDEMAMAMKIAQRKDARGRQLIQLWCKPKRDGTRRTQAEDPLSFDALVQYCKQDVHVERAVLHSLPKSELPPLERAAWEHQMRINDRGIHVDTDMATAIYGGVEKLKEKLSAEAKLLTKGLAPTQREAVRVWLGENGVDAENMKAKTITDLLAGIKDGPIKRVLEIRLQTAMVSVTKYPVLLSRANSDRRLRHSQTYHGAATGRVTHRGFQPGNLPRGEIKGASELIDMLGPEGMGDPDCVAMFHDPMVAYSAAVRSMIVARPGKELFAADYAQIEARYTMYFAGQQDFVDAFARNEDVYSGMAAELYGIPRETIEKESRERQVGKVMVLSCGFGIGPPAFQKYCEEKAKPPLILTLDESKDAVAVFRERVPNLISTWYQIKAAAVNALLEPGQAFPVRGATYIAMKNRKWLFCKLPSGRLLAYLRPRIHFDDAAYAVGLEKYNADPVNNRFPTKEFYTGLVCEGVGGYGNKWTDKIKLWHGTLFQNIVQASCRDIMVSAALRLETAGFPVVLTVHDEIVCEVDPRKDLDEMQKIMVERPSWAKGLPIKVEAWRGVRYRK